MTHRNYDQNQIGENDDETRVMIKPAQVSIISGW